jgi:hypothetical protein
MIEIGHHDVRPFGRKPAGNAKADTIRRPRDERAAPF